MKKVCSFLAIICVGFMANFLHGEGRIYSPAEVKKMQQCKLEELQKRGFLVCLLCDTSNPHVKKAHIADIVRMKETFKEIAQKCQAPIQFVILQGKELNSKKIRKMVKKRAICQNACFVLYYSGGENMAQNMANEYWPMANLYKKKKKTQAASLHDVQVLLQPMQRSHLSFTFFDSYDALLPANKEAAALFQKGADADIHEGLYDLFSRTSGSITASSKRSGHTAYGVKYHGQYGGIFTLLLCKQLSHISETSCMWVDLFKRLSNENEALFTLSSYQAHEKQSVCIDMRRITQPSLSLRLR